jgi:acyl-CoA oxidase
MFLAPTKRETGTTNINTQSPPNVIWSLQQKKKIDLKTKCITKKKKLTPTYGVLLRRYTLCFPLFYFFQTKLDPPQQKATAAETGILCVRNHIVSTWSKMQSSAALWRNDFAAAVADVGDGMSYTQAAERLRQVIRTGLLSHTDIVENPEKFFDAHRILAKHSTRLGPGFWIRFTVHFNLFAGTVVALGTPQQIQALVARNLERPRLGCFGLTEKMAGVNSGLVAETTAEFVDGGFVIRTPNEGAAKNWISQGLVADEAVVVADLTVGGKKYGMRVFYFDFIAELWSQMRFILTRIFCLLLLIYFYTGPQAFLIQLRNPATGELSPGVTAVDMGKKTVGNDLDNARLTFTNVRVPVDALLARYAGPAVCL